MIFQKSNAPKAKEETPTPVIEQKAADNDDIETVVGPSVHVEGDLTSKGNIIVKGMVSGNVHTTRHLTVEEGAKIVANVKAVSATVAGEIKGNIRVKDILELKSTSKVLGDMTMKTLVVGPGALLHGKVSMTGIDPAEKRKERSTTRSSRRSDAA